MNSLPAGVTKRTNPGYLLSFLFSYHAHMAYCAMRVVNPIIRIGFVIGIVSESGVWYCLCLCANLVTFSAAYISMGCDFCLYNTSRFLYTQFVGGRHERIIRIYCQRLFVDIRFRTMCIN